MNFLERLFHLSPDNGSGLTEASYFVIAALLLLLVVRNAQLRHIFWRVRQTVFRHLV